MIRTVSLASVVLGQPELRWSTGSARANRPQVRFRLGGAGRPAEEATLLIIIADDSGSVIGPAGADPISNRYQEAWSAFRAIGRRGGKHELGAVLHFDTPTSGDVPTRPLTRRGLQRLRSGLHVPQDAAGSSCLGPSLLAATKLAAKHPYHQVTLVVLSDFELFDDDPARVLSDLIAFPGEVHAVVLGGTQIDGLFDDRIRVTTARYDDPPGTVARAVFSSLVTWRPGSWVAKQ